MKPGALWRRLTALACAALLALALTGCGAKRYQTTWFDLFDAVIRVSGYCDSEEEWQQQSQALHQDLLYYHRLFDIYHHYDGMTNLADLNDAAGGDPVAVEQPLLELLELGLQVYDLTGGQCNIAAGAVLSLWHDARQSGVLPDAASLESAAQHCDIGDVMVDLQAGTVQITDPLLRLDAGAIAKGWAVEAAAVAARNRGLDSALIDAGSNIRAIGTHANGDPWTAGVSPPWEEDGAHMIQIPLADGQSLVTSADTQRYFEVDGVRYSHLIDLQTLYPAAYFRQVSVLCQDSGLGDALSTGLFCMPLDQGQQLVSSLSGVEAIWYGADNQTVVRSPGFPG